MHKFEMLSSMIWSESFEMLPKGVKINHIPGTIIPLMALLNILTEMVPVDMETNAIIVLTCDWSAIDIERDLLIRPVIDRCDGPKPAMLTVSCCQKIGVDI
jgi:hypothetical protein